MDPDAGKSTLSAIWHVEKVGSKWGVFTEDGKPVYPSRPVTYRRKSSAELCVKVWNDRLIQPKETT